MYNRNDIGATKEALKGLIKHLRMMEVKDDEPMGEKLAEKVMHHVAENPEEELREVDEGHELMPEDLEMEEEEEGEDGLTSKQEEIRDFFNNRRNRGGKPRQSGMMMMEAKVNGKPVAEVIRKSKK